MLGRASKDTFSTMHWMSQRRLKKLFLNIKCHMGGGLKSAKTVSHIIVITP